MNHKVAGFYVTPEEMDLLKKCAEQTRRPINNFVKYAVFEYIGSSFALKGAGAVESLTKGGRMLKEEVFESIKSALKLGVGMVNFAVFAKDTSGFAAELSAKINDIQIISFEDMDAETTRKKIEDLREKRKSYIRFCVVLGKEFENIEIIGFLKNDIVQHLFYLAD